MQGRVTVVGKLFVCHNLPTAFRAHAAKHMYTIYKYIIIGPGVVGILQPLYKHHSFCVVQGTLHKHKDLCKESPRKISSSCFLTSDSTICCNVFLLIQSLTPTNSESLSFNPRCQSSTQLTGLGWLIRALFRDGREGRQLTRVLSCLAGGGN